MFEQTGSERSYINFPQEDSMKKLIALCITVGFLSLSIAAIAGNGPEEVVFENKKGTVTFNHVLHQGIIADCATCHHNGVEQASCRSCHDGAKAPAAKKVFHSLCKDCHKKSDSVKVAGKCSECHTK